MSRRGSNLPDFREVQLAFAAHIRNPELNARPGGVEPRRMQIYLDLFYNNIESFIANAFPITKQILDGTRWHAMVRDFVHRHPSESPYFLEISQEFLTYLGNLENSELPDFLLELCHYEWVELALSVSELEIPDEGVDRSGDLMNNVIVVSPLIWKLAYRYPVHEIGQRHQPVRPPDAATQLVVFRRRDDTVGFLVANPVTFRLLEILETPSSGSAALDILAPELPEYDQVVVREKGIETLDQLRDSEIVLGTQR